MTRELSGGGPIVRRRTATLVLLAIAMAGFAGQVSAQPASHACGAAGSFPNPAMLAAMKRGVNLTGWDAEDPARRPTLAQLQALRARGFTHIRLPLDNRPLDNHLPGDERAAAYLDAMVDRVIGLLAQDFSVSLDLHPDGAVGALFSRDAAQAQTYLLDVWERIAKKVRFFDPDRIAVELLNEPQAGDEAWREAAAKLIPAIRRILPQNTIVVGPAGPQRHEALAAMQPFDDPNVVYAVHYYDPFAFTHQGADWGGADDPLGYLKDLPFPARATDPEMTGRIAALEREGHARAAEVLRLSLEDPWDESGIAAAFDMMAAWSARTGRPVIVNEFGVLNHFSPRAGRLAWLAMVRKAADARCIGWTHWDFQDGFGLMDPRTGLPEAGVMDALTPGG